MPKETGSSTSNYVHLLTEISYTKQIVDRVTRACPHTQRGSYMPRCKVRCCTLSPCLNLYVSPPPPHLLLSIPLLFSYYSVAHCYSPKFSMMSKHSLLKVPRIRLLVPGVFNADPLLSLISCVEFVSTVPFTYISFQKLS